jgi:hypothetical protein
VSWLQHRPNRVLGARCGAAVIADIRLPKGHALRKNAPATTPRHLYVRRLIISLQAALSDALFQKSQPD